MIRVAVSKALRDSMMKRGSRRPFRSWKLALYLPQTLWLVAHRSKSSSRRKPRRSPFQLAVYFYVFLVLLMCGVALHSWHTEQTSALLGDEKLVGRVLTSGFSLPRFGIDVGNGAADSGRINTTELEESAATGGYGIHKKDRNYVVRTEESHAAAGIRKATPHRESLSQPNENAESAGDELASTQGVQRPKRELQQKTTQKSSEPRPGSNEVHATSSRKFKGHAAAEEKEMDLRVTAVEPAHGLRSGGYAVLIRGVNFGPMGSSLIATIGHLPCNVSSAWTFSAILYYPGGGICQTIEYSKNETRHKS
jgi:hypothetical protein